MRPGIYAIASLDGAPLLASDCELLGLDPGSDAALAGGIRARGYDIRTALPSIHIHQSGNTLAVFAGYLDEPVALATSLGIDPAASPALLASLAAQRFGAGAARLIVGEWSLLRWHSDARELTLLGSENTRDPLFWTTNGKLIAVAPDLLLLGKLSWSGLKLDAKSFALSLGRAATRLVRNEQTIWQGIHAVFPATAEVFSPSGRRTISPSPEPDPTPWHGSFEEAVDEVHSLGRRIVRQHIERYGNVTFLLSGGLDSSLLTVWGAEERDAAKKILCLTSAAPSGSGLLDEREFSGPVAAQLGLSLLPFCPPEDMSVFVPNARLFEFSGQPVVGLRHFLYEALFDVANTSGTDAVFDGVMGEFSITAKPREGHDADMIRRAVYAWRRWRFMSKRRAGWPSEAFHARFAPGFLNDLPSEWKHTWRGGMPQPKRQKPCDLRGFHPALIKSHNVDTASLSGVRRVLPFRDRRLLRFAARLPHGFGEYNGESRAMARAVLRGKIPEPVRLRRTGRPFSPDFELRIARQARQARQRVALLREAQVGQWLDLGWLNNALSQLEGGGDPYSAALSQAQITAMTGEFLLWCRSIGARFE